jgi:PPP family 3-phenylpropionic acid transporter
MLAGAAVAVGLVQTERNMALLGIGLLHAAVVAPTTILADALTVAAATPRGRRRPGFEYGWVRGAASAAFVLGSILAGQILRAAPLDAVVWMHAGLLASAAVAIPVVPAVDRNIADEAAARSPVGGVRALLGMAAYRRLVAIAALVLGSHAMHDSFAMVRWNAAGIGPAAGSLLWSEAVVAEVVMFFFVGPVLIAQIGPGGAISVAALAGIIRWTVMSFTTSLAFLSMVQPLHGFTFALFHLASMRMIGATVSPGLAGTAQSLYAAGATAVTASLTVVSGMLYAHFGARGFIVMALLCAVAMPLARGFRDGRFRSPRSRGA